MKSKFNIKIHSCLKKIGLKKNSTVLIHSGLNYLGNVPNLKINKLPEFYFNSLKSYLGKKSTFVFPGFFYDYSRKRKPFDLCLSPPSKSLGSMPLFIFQNKKFFRSKHPLTSLICLGSKAKQICDKSNFNDFGDNSAWSKLLKLDAQVLFFGVPLSESNTFIHFIEFNFGVPHMYTKKFNVSVKKNKKIISRNICAYLRYLNFNINVNQKRLEKDLKKSKILRSVKFSGGEISTIKLKDMLSFGLKKLSKNPYYFLNSPPKFKKNKVPLI